MLPLLPLALGPALAEHRFGLPALVAGLVLAFVGIGLFVATIGFSIGLDGDVFRRIAAVMLALLGLALLSHGLQTRFAVLAGGISDTGNRLIARIAPREGPGGQFVLGLLLGAVWSPCVGPTLGAASLLAGEGHDLGGVALVMAAFGVGAALPLLGIGLLSRRVLQTRGVLRGAARAATFGRPLLGIASLAVAALILTGADRVLETGLVAASPAWLTALTTRF